MTTPEPAAAPAAAPAPAAASSPAAATGTPTHVSQAHQTDYQPASGQAPAAAPASPAAGQPPAAPDVAAMRAYLAEKAKDVPLDGKSDEDVAKLYTDAKAKETPPPAEFKLPDEYKDKAWASKVKSLDDLYKQIDTLDALKGKKSVVPNLKDATPEEREAFYSQLRGKDATEYPIPDNPAFPTLPEAKEAVPKLFMDNGVSPVQAEAIIKGYQDFGAKMVAKQFDPEDYKVSMETAFGKDWEKVTGAVRNTIKGMMNADDQKALDHLPNNMLGVIYRTLGNTVKAFGIKETDAAHFQTPGGAGQTDVASVRQGLRNELAALSMRPHTAQEQQGIIDKLNATYTNDPRLQQAG